MKRNASGHLLVLALGVFLSVIVATSVGCGKSPTAPGDFNPNKPVDTNNRPPCTIDGRSCQDVTGQEHPLAKWSYNVFYGDCSADLSACDPKNEVFPTDDPNLAVPNSEVTYLLKGTWSDKQTVRVCFNHPRVTGRSLNGEVVVFGVSGSDGFYEQNKPNQVCIASVFDMTVPGGVLFTKAASMRFNEFGQDLLENNEGQKNIGLRMR